ncbi:MAG: hypothetical protein KJ804_10580 [Proteobacteria bacterium]|nr:hypothetical protein [Pseudomonadota bacterium]MBU1058748.1 hypothetical protein [Pseudomonadota bacterium]
MAFFALGCFRLVMPGNPLYLILEKISVNSVFRATWIVLSLDWRQKYSRDTGRSIHTWE